jgi:hypothetical protein
VTESLSCGLYSGKKLQASSTINHPFTSGYLAFSTQNLTAKLKTLNYQALINLNYWGYPCLKKIGTPMKHNIFKLHAIAVLRLEIALVAFLLLRKLQGLCSRKRRHVYQLGDCSQWRHHCAGSIVRCLVQDRFLRGKVAPN